MIIEPEINIYIIEMMRLKIGDQAPGFNLPDQNGDQHSLKDYSNSHLILFFYPRDNTPGCTAEACNLRDNYDFFLSKGIKILGISPDNETKHQKFIDKFELPFPLLADVDKKMLNDYGVWGPKKFMGKSYIGVHRTSFIINPEGKIQFVISKVKTKSHSEQIKELMGM